MLTSNLFDLFTRLHGSSVAMDDYNNFLVVASGFVIAAQFHTENNFSTVIILAMFGLAVSI